MFADEVREAMEQIDEVVAGHCHVVEMFGKKWLLAEHEDKYQVYALLIGAYDAR